MRLTSETNWTGKTMKMVIFFVSFYDKFSWVGIWKFQWIMNRQASDISIRFANFYNCFPCSMFTLNIEYEFDGEFYYIFFFQSSDRKLSVSWRISKWNEIINEIIQSSHWFHLQKYSLYIKQINKGHAIFVDRRDVEIKIFPDIIKMMSIDDVAVVHYLDFDFIENLFYNSFSPDAIGEEEPFKNPECIIKQFWIFFFLENFFIFVKRMHT